MNYDELGKKIKEKYPQYKDSSDFDVGVSAAKKYPQYQSVITDNRKAITSKERKVKIAGFQAEDAQLQAEAKKGVSVFDVLKEVPKATAKVVLGTPAKFVKSAIEAPETIARGGAEPTFTKGITDIIPGKSFQDEARQKASDVVEGKASLASAITPFVSVPLAGLETMFLGGLAGKGAKALKGARETKQLGKLAEAISPAVTKKTSIDAFQKAGKPGGVELKGVFRNIVRQPSKQDIEAAKIVKGIVKSKSSPVRNVIRVNKKIDDTSNSIGNFLKTAKIKQTSVKETLAEGTRNLLKNNKFNAESFRKVLKGKGSTVRRVPKYTSKDLSRALNNVKPEITTKSDATLKATFDNIRKTINEVVIPNADDNVKLWEARIKMDDIMDRNFNNLFGSDKYAPTRDAWLQMRRVINNFIETRTVGGSEFTKGMKELNTLYKVRLNLAERNYKLLNTGAFKRFFKLHPNIKKALWYGGAGAVGVGGIKSLIE